jgi:hypothetical protein
MPKWGLSRNHKLKLLLLTTTTTTTTPRESTIRYVTLLSSPCCCCCRCQGRDATRTRLNELVFFCVCVVSIPFKTSVAVPLYYRYTIVIAMAIIDSYSIGPFLVAAFLSTHWFCWMEAHRHTWHTVCFSAFKSIRVVPQKNCRTSQN